ncbi:glycosyltransferase family 39 protein [Alcaligenaceae bacterium]|nr:glycosyltransferase family 39 protein [Alcaligenaceae bacterium]
MNAYTSRPFDRGDALMALALAGLAAVWTVLMALSHSAPDLDGMEELVWAVSLEWGYIKHPPLPSWMLYGLTQLLGRPLWLPFLAGMISSATALWFIWLLGREFTTAGKAAVAVLLVSTTLYFSVRGNLYNHDTAQLWSIAAVTWLFYRALRHQARGTWIWLGAIAALSTLTKYSAVIQFTAFFCFMLRHGSFRDRRNLEGLGLALLAFFAVMLPHLWWLAGTDFAPFRYAGGSLDGGGRLEALKDAASFVGTQLARLSPMLAAWLAWRWWERRRPAAAGDAGPGRPWAAELTSWDRSFLLWVGLTPCLATLLVSTLLGTRLVGAWGTTFFILWGYFLFWCIQGQERETLRRIAIVVLAIQLAMAVGYAFARGPLAWMSGRAARSTFPGAEISATMNDIWSRHLPGAPLRVVASDTWLGGNIALNSGKDVQVFIDARPEESPWLDAGRALQCGILVVYSRVTRRGAEPAPELLALAGKAQWSGVAEQRWSSAGSPLIDLNWAIVAPTADCPLNGGDTHPAPAP